MFTNKESEAYQKLFSNDDFFVSFVVDADLSISLPGKALEKTLNQELELKRYGPIQQTAFVFILVQEPTAEQSNRLSFNPDTRVLNIQIHIHPEQLIAYQYKQYNFLFAQTICAATALIPKLNIPNFNCIYLLRDMNKAFEVKGWLKGETLNLDNEMIYYRWVYNFKGGPQFFFNKVVHPEAINYLENEALSNMLELNIDLDTYGTGLKTIYFTFLADDPEDKMEGAIIDYNPDEAYIETTLPVSYPGLLLMNKQYNRSLLALLFLTSLKFYEKAGLTDFDIQAFHRDSKALFWSEGWLDEKLVKK